MNKLGKEAVDTLINPAQGQAETERAFSSIFGRSFDGDKIAYFLSNLKDFNLSKKMNPAQKKRFRDIVIKRITKSYANRFKDYKGVEFKATKETPDPDRVLGSDIIVESTLKKPGDRTETLVDWKISSAGGGHKIVDVLIKTAGSVSMLFTIRDDYRAELKKAMNSGGDDNKIIETFLNGLGG
jgi:ABC-type transporter MlaC component